MAGARGSQASAESDRVVIGGGARIGREKLERGGQLRAAPDVSDHQRRPIVPLRVNDDGRCAEDAIESGFRAADVADVLDGEFVRAARRFPNQTEIRQVIPFARQPGADPQGTAAPEQPFPRKGRVHGLPKLTLGTCLASAGAWKSGYSLKPNIFAVMLAGNCRRDVLYFCTASL